MALSLMNSQQTTFEDGSYTVTSLFMVWHGLARHTQFEGWLHWQPGWVAVSLGGPGPPRRLEVAEICGNEELLPSWPFLSLCFQI